MNASASRVAIIGAGIVGVATAIWLRRHGFQTILIDRSAPGEGASFGNAGILAASSVTPVTAPGMIPKVARYCLDPEFPLYVIWRKLPGLAPWLVRYLRHANDQDTRRISRGLASIVFDAVRQHRDLAHQTRAEKWLVDADYVYAYESREMFENEGYTWGLRDEVGFRPWFVSGNEIGDYLPGLGSHIRFLAVLPEHGFVLNPGNYVKDLARSLEDLGGTIIQASVKNIDMQGGKVAAVDTDQGRFECSRAVVAAGVWSRALLAKLGVNVPMQTERGYHILFREPSVQLPVPVMVASGKFVMTPMAIGLRCAGVLEFGGLSSPPSQKPLDLIRRQTMRTLPGLRFDRTEEWLGHRPAPCDSLPFIGEVRSSGVFAAFGHHHVGLTSGPKTGRIIADVIAGNSLPFSIVRYDPMRYTLS